MRGGEKMRKFGMLLAFLVTIATIGIVSAADGPSINICTDSPSICANTVTKLTVYKGVDSSVSPGLHALFANWDTTGSVYILTVQDISVSPAVTVYGPAAGTITNGKIYYGAYTDGSGSHPAWTPAKEGDGIYKVKAHGEQDNDPGLEADVTVSTRPNSVPELPTSALLSIGLIGLIGMVKLRRKN
jgi:hypothetical protein